MQTVEAQQNILSKEDRIADFHEKLKERSKTYLEKTEFNYTHIIKHMDNLDLFEANDSKDWREFLARINGLYNRSIGIALEYVFRDVFIKNFSFSIPSKQAIKAIKKFAGDDTIYEYMSGSGYWAYLMRKNKINIVPSDVSHEWESITWSPFLPIENKNAKLPQQEMFDKNNIMMLSWIPYMSDDGNCVLNNMISGQRLIHIGESYGGCTGSDSFFDILKEDFKEINVESYSSREDFLIPQFDGMRDYLEFYVKK